MFKYIWIFLFVLLSISCSEKEKRTSGNPGNTPNPATTNRAPVFLSAGTFVVEEGSTASGYAAEATDPDGDTISYSIVSGADQARATINVTTGRISFVEAPDFEFPTDANSDNQYELDIQASDGSLRTLLKLVIVIQNVIEPAFAEAGVVRLNGSSPNDLLGRGLTLGGDIDSDNFAELAIGSVLADPFGKNSAGASYIIAGKAIVYDDDGLIDLAALTLDQGWRLSGEDPGDRIAVRQSLGDLNSDGVADLLLTVPGKQSVYAINGNAIASSPTVDILLADLLAANGPIDRFTGGINQLVGQTGGSKFGDFDLDGFVDVIISGSGQSSAIASENYLVYGGSLLSGASQSFDLSAAGQPASKVVLVQSSETGDLAGWSLQVIPDIDGDAAPDILITAPNAKPNGVEEVGAVYMLFSRSLPATGSVNLADIGVVPNLGLEIRGNAIDNGALAALTGLSDIDGDGRAEIVIGSTGSDPNGRVDAGIVFVLFSTGLLNDADGIIDLSTYPANPIEGLRLNGERAGDFNGVRVSSGDFNADNIDDVLLTGLSNNLPGRVDAGEAFLVSGKALRDSITTDIELSRIITEPDLGVYIIGRAAGDIQNNELEVAFGSDIDADGYDDVALGAPNGDGSAGQDSGYVFILSGRMLTRLLNSADSTLDLANF